MRLLPWPVIGALVMMASSCGSSAPAMTSTGGGDELTLLPGDDIFVAADLNGDALTNLRRIAAPAAPQDVVHLTFKQETLSGSLSADLTVDNFFSRQLVYHAGIHESGTPANQFSPTDTCPVRPAIRVLELWPEALTSIFVRDFLLKDGDQSCVYY